MCGATFGDEALFCPADGAALRGEPGAGAVDPYLSCVILDHIEIRSLAGVGAMGRVYRAFQRGVDRDVAVKLLHRELSANEQLVARFQREAKVASRLQHPNVVHVHLAGQLPDGAVYIVMEYLDGLSLQSALAEAGGAMDLSRALHVTLQICDAVGEGHAQGVVHRDIKPENVMLVQRASDPDFVKVLDFGIARLDWAEQSMATAAGLIFGTARYISPEGAQGDVVGPPADVYGIATLLYQLLAGRTPFEGEQAVGLLVRQIHDPPPLLRSLPRGARVPEAIAAVIMQNLAKSASDRAPDARALGRALLEAARNAGIDSDQLGGHALLRSALPLRASPAAREPVRTLRQEEVAEASVVRLSPVAPFAELSSTAPLEHVPPRITTQPLVSPPFSSPRALGLETAKVPLTPSPPRVQTQMSMPLPAALVAVDRPVEQDRARWPQTPPATPPDTQPDTQRETRGEPHQAPSTRRGRLRAVVIVAACFLLGATVTGAIVFHTGIGESGSGDTARNAWTARAEAAVTSRSWAAPEGENVLALITAGLEKWPGDARLLALRARAKSGLIGQATADETQGRRAEALALLRITHKLDPADGEATLLIRELESATLVSPAAAVDAGAARAIPPVAAVGQLRATLDFSPVKPLLGKPFEVVARVFTASWSSPRSTPTEAQFVVSGPGLSAPLSYPATADAQGVARAAVMPLDPGRFEVVFSAKVDGVGVRVSRVLVLSAPVAPLPLPVTPAVDAGKWL